MGIPPLSLILPDTQPTDKWTIADKNLVMAWTILEKETCQECGKPLWICRSSDSNLAFSVRKGMCYAKLAMEKHRETPAGKDPKKGETQYVVSTRFDEELPLPSRRNYLEELADD